jgi:hypothetical protein
MLPKRKPGKALKDAIKATEHWCPDCALAIIDGMVFRVVGT